MSRRSKFSPELKLALVSHVIGGKCSVAEAAREVGAEEVSIRLWLSEYRLQGACFAEARGKYRHYPLSLTLAVVQDYLAGLGTMQEICFRHVISSPSCLGGWLKAYNDGTLKETRARWLSHVKSGRSTTHEERVEIVKFCIENDCDYGLTVETFGVSYHQIYAWVMTKR